MGCVREQLGTLELSFPLSGARVAMFDGFHATAVLFFLLFFSFARFEESAAVEAKR
jgi:hypothetical protein